MAPARLLRPLRLLLGAGLAVVLAAAFAAPAGPDWAALERGVIDDPKATIAQVEGLRRDLRARGDAAGELEALLVQTQAQSALELRAELMASATEAIALSRRLRRPAAEARALAAKADALSLAGEYGQAEALLQDARRVLGPVPEPRAAADVALQLGHVYENRQELGKAMQQYMRAYELFERVRHRDFMVTALSSIASLYDRMGEHELAIKTYLKTLSLDQARGNRINLSVTHYNLGVAYRDQQRYVEAERHFRASRTLSEELKDRAGLAYVDYQLGYLALARGQAAEALPWFERALPAFAGGQNVVMHFQALLGQARAKAMRGDAAALTLLAEAGRLEAELKAPERSQAYHERAAEIHAVLGRYPEAYRHMQALREVEQAMQKHDQSKQAQELQARFELKQKDQENSLLRAQQELQGAQLARQDSERWIFSLALSLAVLLLGGGGAFLWREMRLKRAFADLALRDELTGSHNRRGILEYAQRRYAEVRQSGGHFSIALLDLDHFKAINDRFGHDVGDAVLQAFAVIAQARLRESDWLGRYGGEEWLLVMPGTPASQAESIFARLRTGLAALALPELPAGYPIAFSMGVAELKASDEDVPALLKRADQALYAAKSGGRDRYVVAD